MVTSPDDKPVSSTRIRRLVATGQVEAVIPLLGRMHSVEGVVVHGDGRGRGLGIPDGQPRDPRRLGDPEPRRVRRARGPAVGRSAPP